jgi:FlaA1/EpsC-like NDP-sugar epimerase
MVRFGNVLDSSGSVIPLFKKQIKNGGPVTVTDRNVIRYFMTIEEASLLVIQAGSMNKSSGDVFLLDMGKPVKILDLEKKMITLSGLEIKDSDHPNGDIEIIFTGLRSGEKLYEELLIGDKVLKTNHKLILSSIEEMMPWKDLKILIDDLKTSQINRDYISAINILTKAVPGFKPKNKLNDPLHLIK